MTEPETLASVVVAVRGDQRARRLLRSLVDQTIDQRHYEVLVVENGSADLTDVDGFGGGLVRYLHLPEANTAAARNAGLSVARGRYLLLTDADCVAHADWVERMTARLAEGLVVVGGIIHKHTPRTWTQRHAVTVVDGQRALSYLPALDLPYVAGANAGFRTEELRAVGGFDEDLRSGNDVDVCYRLGLRGHRVELAPEAVVAHEDRATVAAHFHRFRRYAVYQVLLYAKYRHISGRRFVVDSYPFRRAWRAFGAAPRSVAALLRSDPGPASRAVLQLVEAAGVLCGELQGAVRFRQVYL